MTRFLFAALLFISLPSLAGTYTSYQGSAYRTINGNTYWKGDSGTFAQSKATVIESVKVAGTHIGVPHIGEFGAAAATTVIGAIRTTPGAFLTTAAASWLLEQGIQYLNGEFKKQGESFPASGYSSSTISQCAGSTGWIYEGPKGVGCNITDAVCAGEQVWYANNPATCSPSWHTEPYVVTRANVAPPQSCPAGSTLNAGACRPDLWVSAGQSDWDRVNGVTPPDQVMKDVCSRLSALGGSSYGCPTTTAKTQTATVSLTDWATNPQTGKMTRSVAKFTPAPTAEDPFRGEITIEEETKTPATTNPETGVTTPETVDKKDTTKEEDFCTLHPDSIGCSGWGEPEDVELKTEDKQVIITPDMGFGPASGSCPSPLTHTMHGGTVVTFSYQPICTGANILRPIVIGLAWMTSALIFLGIARRAQG